MPKRKFTHTQRKKRQLKHRKSSQVIVDRMESLNKQKEQEKEQMSETTSSVEQGDMGHVYYSSTNYEKFSLIYFNRPIEEEKVQKLIKAIREGRNYLHNYPIIVNNSFEIAEGQHRHEAAKREEVRLYYIIDDEFKMEDAISANTVTSGWTTKEYMESYSKRKFPEYMKIEAFYLENTWIKMSVLPNLCSSKGFTKLNFQNGHYVADRMEFAGRVVAMTNSFRAIIGDKQAEYRPFVQTLQNLALNPNYIHKRMIEKMKQRVGIFQRCTTVEQYLGVLTEIYNYRVSPDKRIYLSDYYLNQRWQREKEEAKTKTKTDVPTVEDQ